MPPNPSIQSLARECAEEINAITTTKEITDIIVAKLSPCFEELLKDKFLLDELQFNNLIHVRVFYNGKEAFTKPYSTPTFSVREAISQVIAEKK